MRVAAWKVVRSSRPNVREIDRVACVAFGARVHASRQDGFLASVVPGAYTVGLCVVSGLFGLVKGTRATYWLLACPREAACARTSRVWAVVDCTRCQSPGCKCPEAVMLYAVISILSIRAHSRAFLRSATPAQRWSPIMEISTWLPHCEHFIVGKKADSLGIAMLARVIVLCSSSAKY